MQIMGSSSIVGKTSLVYQVKESLTIALYMKLEKKCRKKKKKKKK